MKKNLLTIITICFFVNLLFIPIFAEANSQDIRQSIGISFEGVKSNVTGLNINGCILIPIRDVFEQLESKVDWIGKTKTITITKDNHIAITKIGDENVTIDGEKVKLTEPTIIYKGKTFVDSALVSYYGYTISTDDKIHMINITAKPATVPEVDTKFEVSNIAVKSDKTVEVIFNHKLDKNSAENFANYAFSPSLKISSIVLDPLGTKVLITTSDKQRIGVLYSFTINNIIDEFGNNIGEYQHKFAGMGIAYAGIGKVIGTTLEVIYKVPVDRNSAVNIENYKINMQNNELATTPVLDVKWDPTNTKVILTMDNSEGRVYGYSELAIDNVITDEGEIISQRIPFGRLAIDEQDKKIIWPPIKYILPRVNGNIIIYFGQDISNSVAMDISNFTVYSVDDNTKVEVERNYFIHAQDELVVNTAGLKKDTTYKIIIRKILNNDENLEFLFTVK